MRIKGYAALKQGANLEKFEYKPEDLKAMDVEVKITHCGICHSDIHLIDNDWYISKYPFIPGHEIVGTVKSAGKDVKNLKVGDRVGIGWQRSSCLICRQCLHGEENLCRKSEDTCVEHHGGFAEAIRTDSRFAYNIPKDLSSEHTAPLLCAGITVYSPLSLYARPEMRVGIIGVGGLGHLAIQYANAFGCEVTVFSSTPSKKEEAVKFGAHNFVAGTDRETLKKHQSSLDFILSTVHANLDWTSFVNILKPKGHLCFVGAADKPINVHVFNLISGRKTISGSPIGSRAKMREMLDFSVRHNIKPKIEVVPMAEINSAIQRVRENKARYRMVLKNK